MTIIIHCAQQLATFHRGCSANGTDCTHLFLPEISQHGAVARGNCLQIVPQVFLINVRILVFGFFAVVCVFVFYLRISVSSLRPSCEKGTTLACVSQGGGGGGQYVILSWRERWKRRVLPLQGEQ